MRPRVFPAEDAAWCCRPYCSDAHPASMRPRVFPAEDGARLELEVTCCDRRSFNEAAGIPRGRRWMDRAELTPHVEYRASMRPRVFPAEDDHGVARASRHGITHASMRPRVFPAEDENGTLERLPIS